MILLFKYFFGVAPNKKSQTLFIFYIFNKILQIQKSDYWIFGDNFFPPKCIKCFYCAEIIRIVSEKVIQKFYRIRFETELKPHWKLWNTWFNESIRRNLHILTFFLSPPGSCTWRHATWKLHFMVIVRTLFSYTKRIM